MAAFSFAPRPDEHAVETGTALSPKFDAEGLVTAVVIDADKGDVLMLAHMNAAGHISVASGLRYVKEICHALALVHHQGAVHRDLSPDNIL